MESNTARPRVRIVGPEDQAALLDQLRLDRQDSGSGSEPQREETTRSRSPLLLIAIAVGGLLLAGAGWYAFRKHQEPAASVAATGDAAESATADVPDESAQSSGPATAVPKPAAHTASDASLLDASGYVVARRQATVSAKVTGKVIEAMIEEGQSVEQGQVMARLDDSNYRAQLAQSNGQLARALANLEASQTALEDQRPTFARSRKEYQEGLISAQTFETATASYNTAKSSLKIAEEAVKVERAGVVYAEQMLDDTIVRAPFSGIVTVKTAQAGEMVSPLSAGGSFIRSGIGTIVDMNSLEAAVDVSESFISRVQAGQPTVIVLNAYPDWQIPGEVIAVIPAADRTKATVRVRIAFKVVDPRILPDMGARVSFLDARGSGKSGKS